MIYRATYAITVSSCFGNLSIFFTGPLFCCLLLGNFFRIRGALKFGAHKLGQILLRPRDEIADEIYNFFSNICARHEVRLGSSNGHLAVEFSDEDSLTASLSSPVELMSNDDDMVVKLFLTDSDDDLESRGELDRHSMKEVSPEMASEACDSSDETFVSVGGKYGVASPCSNLRKGDYMLSHNTSSESHSLKLHYLASRSSAESGSSEDQIKFDFNPWLKNREEHAQMNNTFQWCMDNHEAAGSCITGSNSTSKASNMENPSLDFREIDSASVGGESEVFNPLADLTGDYDSNIRSLLRAQLCHRSASSAAPANPLSPPPYIQKKTPWHEEESSQMDSHLMPTDRVMYVGVDSAFLGTGLLCEGKQKTRGLGTYFPDMVSRSSHYFSNNIHPNLNSYMFMCCRVLSTWRGLHIGGAGIIKIITTNTAIVTTSTLLVSRTVLSMAMAPVKLCPHEEDLKDSGRDANLLMQSEVGTRSTGALARYAESSLDLSGILQKRLYQALLMSNTPQ